MKWIKIKDTLPMFEDAVLVCSEDWNISIDEIVICKDVNGSTIKVWHYSEDRITHWMPVPKPPIE